MTVPRDSAEALTVTRGDLRRVLVVLCTTELTSWGILFYAFPVLSAQITTTTGWSTTSVTAALSASQLVAALVGIPVGRWLDRHGPRTVMTAGSALAVLAIISIASSSNLWWFFAAWVLAGVAMGAVLYPPAFAALTRWHGAERVRALTMVTLAGGLASTVFAPLTAWLSTLLSWRETYLVLAVLLAVVTIPAHCFGLRPPWPPRPAPESEHQRVDPGHVARSRAFLILTVSLSVAAFSTYAVVINLVPLLEERGVSPAAAAVALGVGGAGQVAGRLGYVALARRTSVRARTLAIVMAMAATTAMLGLLTNVTALVFTAVLAGAARGVFTLLQATAVTDRWGTRHYGRLTGLLSAPLTTAMAMAPFMGALLAELLGGYATAFLMLGAVAAAAAVCTLGATAPPDQARPPA